jgi:lipopolysaccharide biosynthesis glycosyltransferase
MPMTNAICLCTDQKMLAPAAFVAARARAYVKHSSDTRVIVVVDPQDITTAQRRWFDASGIDVCDDIPSARFGSTRVVNPRLTPATLTKLVLAEHWAGRYKKILYLDSDLTIHGDISRLFSLETGSSAVAAVRAWWYEPTAGDRDETARLLRQKQHCHQLGMREPFLYVNSGVVYIDVQEWNRRDTTARAMEYLRLNGEQSYCPDQDALNAVHENSVTELSPIWNMRFEGWMPEPMFEIARPIVRHHVGLHKPWHRFHGRRPLFGHRETYRSYKKFFRNTPWSDWLRSQWTSGHLRANITAALSDVSARLRGRPPGPSRRPFTPAYIDAFGRYCRQRRFADVDQGIATWEGGQLCLRDTASVGLRDTTSVARTAAAG